MPEKKTAEKAKRELEEGKSASTAAGEFVREEVHHVREGKHGARSPQQAVAIGLSKARRAGVPLKPPGEDRAGARTRKSAKRDYEVGQGKRKGGASSSKRKRATSAALKRERKGSASRGALSKQAKRSSTQRKRKGAKTQTQAARRRR
jgi:hypothetical protein